MNNLHLSALCEHAGIEVPLICGPMYPCSNPELVAAVSAAGGLGVIQPVSMEYIHKTPLRDGIHKIVATTNRPIGMNALIEESSRTYRQRVDRWISIALEEGVRFFITSLGNPKWVVDKVQGSGGIVYHDVIHLKHAKKALQGGVSGFIAVNNRAGGHAGSQTAQALLNELSGLGLPVVCAGGVSTPESFVRHLDMGYAGIQMGTRFIATEECNAHDDYKQAVIRANEGDIVLTERMTGVPVSVIRTPFIDRIGTKTGPITRWMLRGRRRKKIMRTLIFLQSARKLRSAHAKPVDESDYLQAGKSVAGIHEIVPAGEFVRRCHQAWKHSRQTSNEAKIETADTIHQRSP